MRNYQEIAFVGHEEVSFSFEDESAFQYRDDRGWMWVQRACFGVLRKLGCFYQRGRTEIRMMQIDADTFMERLWEQKRQIFELFGKEGTTLLIGRTDYEDLMYDLPPNQVFEFMGTYHKPGQVMGLRIKVLPWLKGVVVV